MVLLSLHFPRHDSLSPRPRFFSLSLRQFRGFFNFSCIRLSSFANRFDRKNKTICFSRAYRNASRRFVVCCVRTFVRLYNFFETKMMCNPKQTNDLLIFFLSLLLFTRKHTHRRGNDRDTHSQETDSLRFGCSAIVFAPFHIRLNAHADTDNAFIHSFVCYCAQLPLKCVCWAVPFGLNVSPANSILYLIIIVVKRSNEQKSKRKNYVRRSSQVTYTTVSGWVCEPLLLPLLTTYTHYPRGLTAWCDGVCMGTITSSCRFTTTWTRSLQTNCANEFCIEWNWHFSLLFFAHHRTRPHARVWRGNACSQNIIRSNACGMCFVDPLDSLDVPN